MEYLVESKKILASSFSFLSLGKDKIVGVVEIVLEV